MPWQMLCERCGTHHAGQQDFRRSALGDGLVTVTRRMLSQPARAQKDPLRGQQAEHWPAIMSRQARPSRLHERRRRRYRLLYTRGTNVSSACRSVTLRAHAVAPAFQVNLDIAFSGASMIRHYRPHASQNLVNDTPHLRRPTDTLPALVPPACAGEVMMGRPATRTASAHAASSQLRTGRPLAY